MPNTSLYDELGVDPEASGEEIRSRYRQLARRKHPDVQGDEDAMKRLNNAYDTLGDPDKRARYDAGVPVSDLEAKAKDILAHTFVDLIQSGVERDRMGYCRRFIQQAKRTMEAEQRKSAAEIKLLRGRLGKVKVKPGARADDLYTGVINGRLDQLEETLKLIAVTLPAYDRALVMLEDYESEEMKFSSGFDLSEILANHRMSEPPTEVRFTRTRFLGDVGKS